MRASKADEGEREPLETPTDVEAEGDETPAEPDRSNPADATIPMPGFPTEAIDPLAEQTEDLSEEAAAEGEAEQADDEGEADGRSHEDGESGKGEADDKGIPNEGDITIALPDLSGYDTVDESIVAEGYEKPASNWHDGHTMRMERVNEGDAPKSKDFLASSTAGRRRNKKIIAIVAIVIVVLAAAAAFITYYLQIWGGKSVPDVTGLTQAEATAILEDEGFSVRAFEVKSDDTEGLVLVMDPNSGSRAEKGSEIVIHIATARLVPEIIGKTKEEAASALKESGFENVSYKEELSDETEGTVIGVSPEPGKRAKSADEIAVQIAKPYTVPDISNMYLEDAQTAIEEAGLAPDVDYVRTDDYPDGIIIGTDPAMGTHVSQGDTVTIQISRSREVECIGLTQAYLTPGSTFTLNGFDFEVQSLDNATYMGDSTVAYTVTARPFVSGFGETAYFSPQSISGQIVWNDANQVESMV